MRLVQRKIVYNPLKSFKLEGTQRSGTRRGADVSVSAMSRHTVKGIPLAFEAMHDIHIPGGQHASRERVASSR